MMDPAAVERLAIQFCFLDVDVLRGIVMGFDSEGFARAVFRIELNFYFVKHRAGYLVFTIAGVDRMDPHRGQHIPGRHLTDIFIATNSISISAIGFVANGACPFLSQPRHADFVEQERHLMHWFVSVIVIVVPQKVGRCVVEQRHQLGGKMCASHQLD